MVTCMKKFLFIIVMSNICLVGCNTSVSSLINAFTPSLSDEESFKYEKEVLNEYENLRKVNYQKVEKWIQPINKKQQCKIFVSGYKDKIDSFISDNKFYWDGECKNGFAYGLGREFVKGVEKDQETLGVYSGNQTAPIYYYMKDNLLNAFTLGKETSKDNGKYLSVVINDSVNNFNIFNIIAANDDNVLYTSMLSPFSMIKVFSKVYPNFSYVIKDFSQELNSPIKFEIYLQKNNIPFGYVVYIKKDGNIVSGKYGANGKIEESVKLPDSYIEHMEDILYEIGVKTNIGSGILQTAESFKKQYKNNICKIRAKSPFNTWENYKDICDEDKYFTRLNESVKKKTQEIQKIQREQQEIKARQLEIAQTQNLIKAEANRQSMQKFNETMQKINSDQMQLIQQQTLMLQQNMPNIQMKPINTYNVNNSNGFWCKGIGGSMIRCW